MKTKGTRYAHKLLVLVDGAMRIVMSELPKWRENLCRKLYWL